jgi:hypothetical protein
MYAFRQGLRRDLGVSTPQHYVLYDGPYDANSLLLTPNTETVYGFTYLALDRDGPTVVEAPAGALGFFNDMWMREVENVGPAGPDGGQDGSYLALPPAYDGEVPDGYFVVRPKTFGVWLALRAFRTPEGDAAPGGGGAQERPHLSAGAQGRPAGDGLHQRLGTAPGHDPSGRHPLLRGSGRARRGRASKRSILTRRHVLRSGPPAAGVV